MQLVKTNRDALLRPLQIVSGIVERRHTLPILANILIRKEGDELSLLSTDIEVQISTHAAIGAGKESAATTVAGVGLPVRQSRAETRWPRRELQSRAPAGQSPGYLCWRHAQLP